MKKNLQILSYFMVQHKWIASYIFSIFETKNFHDMNAL